MPRRLNTLEEGPKWTEHWMILDALRMAYLVTNVGFRQQQACELIGTTCLTCLVSPTHLYVACTGDSRAVLRRGGRTVPLSCDQKPTRGDEADRVKSCGGRIYMTDGFRVEGILGMTRAIGDVALEKCGVSPEPEFTVLQRMEDDEVIVMATDGLWEVMTNEAATATACKVLARVQEKGHSRNAGCRHAAKVLAHHAFKSGSSDNITVTVIDLKGDDFRWDQLGG